MTRKEIIESLEELKKWVMSARTDDYEGKAFWADRLMKINYYLGQTKTPARDAAMSKAREARTKEARKKMENAINLLRMEGYDMEQITPYLLARHAGVHYNTAKKYLEL